MHDSAWLPAKREWCCHNRALGCMKTTTTQPYDCNAGYANWEAGWSTGKKSWCCEKFGKACDPYDCSYTNVDTWQPSKKAYCCPKTGKGCPTTTSVPYDCNAGYANWEAGWPTGKKSWCCEKFGKACDPYDCIYTNVDTWQPSKKAYCCPKTGKGCPTTTPV